MRIPTYVYGEDPILEAGVAAQLRGGPRIEVLGEDRLDEAVVGVVAFHAPDDDALRVVRALHRSNGPQVVLVVGRCDEGRVLDAVDAGISGLLRHAEATRERLAQAVETAAAGQGSLPPDVLGRLLGQVRRLRDGATLTATPVEHLQDRELSVLRLVADGLDTRQIADQLGYSERTIKGTIQDVTRRLGLRNRSHAVAYAVRQGLI